MELHRGTRVGALGISHKAAYKCLKEYRSRTSDEHGGVRLWEHDLTHAAFDWKRYLSHHPQSDELIGAGVVKFEVRFLSTYDRNMSAPRCDFIVHRSDGTAARLHPLSAGPGQIVTGWLGDWLPGANARPF